MWAVPERWVITMPPSYEPRVLGSICSSVYSISYSRYTVLTYGTCVWLQWADERVHVLCCTLAFAKQITDRKFWPERGENINIIAYKNYMFEGRFALWRTWRKGCFATISVLHQLSYCKRCLKVRDSCDIGRIFFFIFEMPALPRHILSLLLSPSRVLMSISPNFFFGSSDVGRSSSVPLRKSILTGDLNGRKKKRRFSGSLSRKKSPSF